MLRIGFSHGRFTSRSCFNVGRYGKESTHERIKPVLILRFDIFDDCIDGDHRIFILYFTRKAMLL